MMYYVKMGNESTKIQGQTTKKVSHLKDRKDKRANCTDAFARTDALARTDAFARIDASARTDARQLHGIASFKLTSKHFPIFMSRHLHGTCLFLLILIVLICFVLIFCFIFVGQCE